MAGSRTAFIAPAGYGKTHAIVDRVGSSPAKTLVLTHTNAGVTAINCRLREVGIGRPSFNLSTIAAYCELWARAYPEISGFDALAGLASSERYERIYPAAKRVFSEKWAQRVIGASYSYVIVDEYQDCTVDQRDALFSLAAEVDLVVYGDPMQGVFYWAGALADMRDPSFDVRMLDSRPYRWINADAEELGSEIARIREELLPTLCGEGVSVRLRRDVRGLTVIDPTNADRGGLLRLFARYGARRSFLYLTAREAGELSFCKRNPGFQVNETIECTPLTEWCARLETSTGAEHALRLLEFAELCFTGLSSDLKPYKKRLEAGDIDFGRMRKLPELSRLLVDSAVGGGHGSDFAVLDWMERSSAGFRVVRGQLLGEMKRALRHASARSMSLAEAVVETHGGMESYEARYGFRHVASRTVLSKGLEYDVVAVDAATIKDPRDFYVAVSRCRVGLIIVTESDVLHFKGVAR